MLRCVLEGYTHLRIADQARRLNAFGLPADTIVPACPSVLRGWRFGIVAIIAAIADMIAGGMDTASVFCGLRKIHSAKGVRSKSLQLLYRARGRKDRCGRGSRAL